MKKPIRPASGAVVQYCGHSGYFAADISTVEGAVVVRAAGKVAPETLIRNTDVLGEPTHHIVDFYGGFWRPDLGVFVLPKKAVRVL